MRCLAVALDGYTEVKLRAKIICFLMENQSEIVTEPDTWKWAAGVCCTAQKDTEMVHGEVEFGEKIICYLKNGQSEFVMGCTWKNLRRPDRNGRSAWPLCKVRHVQSERCSNVV